MSATDIKSAARGQRAMVLFAHGARDPAWATPFERLRQLIAGQQPDIVVAQAFLELMSPSLPELVQRWATEQPGITEITIVPVFLGQGGHVRRDLPALITSLAAAHPLIDIRVTEAVGENLEVLQAISRYCISQL